MDKAFFSLNSHYLAHGFSGAFGLERLIKKDYLLGFVVNFDGVDAPSIVVYVVSPIDDNKGFIIFLKRDLLDLVWVGFQKAKFYEQAVFDLLCGEFDYGWVDESLVNNDFSICYLFWDGLVYGGNSNS